MGQQSYGHTQTTYFQKKLWEYIEKDMKKNKSGLGETVNKRLLEYYENRK